MDNKERYKQLKIENDEKMATLVDSYHFIANNYVLKARGYAEKNLDTEARIKDVLDELVAFCEKGLPAPMAIPNTNEYIKEKISLLAKRNDKGEKIKSIIWTVLFFGFIASCVLLGLFFRTDNYLEDPTNISWQITQEESFELSWDKVRSASFGYYVYYYEGEEKKEKYVSQPLEENVTRVSCIIDIDITKEYTFYIYADDVTKGEQEDFVVIYRGSNHVEYKYTPSEKNQ